MARARSTKTQKDRTAIQRTAKTVKESAKNIEESASSIEGTSDRSTLLASDRTIFAAERTYAAWVRTGLASLASGIGAKALLGKVVPDSIAMFASTILVLFSAFCFCAAVWRELVPRLRDPVPNAKRIPRFILFAINGSLALVSPAALVGIWISWRQGR
jgi:putative membrane protein